MPAISMTLFIEPINMPLFKPIMANTNKAITPLPKITKDSSVKENGTA